LVNGLCCWEVSLGGSPFAKSPTRGGDRATALGMRGGAGPKNSESKKEFSLNSEAAGRRSRRSGKGWKLFKEACLSN